MAGFTDNGKPFKKKENPEKAQVNNGVHAVPDSEKKENPFSIFPRPEDNFKVRTEICLSNGIVWPSHNTEEQLKRHLQATGGKVFTRFPPEPNGYLHIGHAKAMFVNFGLAKERDGCCYLRFDDTNPEAEKMEYIEHIEDIVQWMGWKPFKVTYTSDYFQDLHDLAVELIQNGRAYVDHQTPDEIKVYRGEKKNSPWRDRPIAESLKLFDEMRRGMIDEGKATLRMKQDMQSDNKNMCDLIAYRIKFIPHPHAGDKWCIYPSYDFSHCIIDSIENITHSLCTLEFETRRTSYDWLLVALGLYQPYVWEYSRLNICNTVLSKRKLNRLVAEKWVDGWDDPRLMTLAGLRRRGVPSICINNFVEEIGISRSDSSRIQLDNLEHHIREELNSSVPRTMVVLHPLKVVITNLDSGSVIDLNALIWPNRKSSDCYKVGEVIAWVCYIRILGGSSSHTRVGLRESVLPSSVPFTNTIYIERSDFRTKDSKDYYGLAPGKSVLLRYAFPIKCTEVIYGSDSETIVEIRAEYDPSKQSKPKKGCLHWVAQPSPGVDPLKVEVRLFNKLFIHEDPENPNKEKNPRKKVKNPSKNENNPSKKEENPSKEENPCKKDDWLADLNPQSKEVILEAFAVPSLSSAAMGNKFQFERLGYFAVDLDSTPEKLVFNRTVTLHDSYSKGKAKIGQ